MNIPEKITIHLREKMPLEVRIALVKGCFEDFAKSGVEIKKIAMSKDTYKLIKKGFLGKEEMLPNELLKKDNELNTGSIVFEDRI